MTIFISGDVELNYEVHGEGDAVLLFAPGGMRSAIEFWHGSPFDPIAVLSQQFKVIAMDQRNAGQSTAPISASDNWSTYTQDHINLLDHLGIDSCHVMGGCIGGSYCFGLMQAQPDRIKSAIIQQTIGLDNNREAFYAMFDGWAERLDPKPEDAILNQFRSNMYDGEFVFSVEPSFVAQNETPLLVLMGNDLYHPESISRTIADLAPNASLIENWKGDEVSNTVQAVREFLLNNS